MDCGGPTQGSHRFALAGHECDWQLRSPAEALAHMLRNLVQLGLAKFAIVGRPGGSLAGNDRMRSSNRSSDAPRQRASDAGCFKGFSGPLSSVWLSNRQHLICRDVHEGLNFPVWPTDLDLGGSRCWAEPEMDATV